MMTPYEYLSLLETQLQSDADVDAAWLAGSFGRGDDDRWSDIDLHLLLSPGGENFRSSIEPWLSALRPLVLFKLLFDNQMVNALTLDGVRLDIWFHTEPTTLDATKTRILFDAHHRLHFQPLPERPSAAGEETGKLLSGQIEEFWRCIAMLPVVIGRREYIVGLQGLQVELALLLEILLRGNSIVRAAGVKKLNQYLPPLLRDEIETALAHNDLTAAGLARAHLGLAELVRQHGRTLAQRWDFEYPVALEAAVLRYVAEELVLLGLH
jgi:predicted nucleotidyltransferase